MKHLKKSSKSNFLDSLILLLSIYVLAALLIQESMELDAETLLFLLYADTLICLVFLIDFAIRFAKADNKSAFMRWGWIDLLSSIPMIDPLRYGRIVRVIRILRALHASRLIVNHLLHRRTTGILALLVICSALIIIISAVTVLQVERSVEGANIHELRDAIWWAFVTITTVGFGDFFPVSVVGRIVSALLMTVGVGLFASLTGAIVANTLVRDDDKKEEDRTRQEISLLMEKVDALHAEVGELRGEFQRNRLKAPAE